MTGTMTAARNETSSEIPPIAGELIVMPSRIMKLTKVMPAPAETPGTTAAAA